MKRRFTQPQCTNALLDLSSVPPKEDSIVANRIHKIDSYSQLPKYVDGGSLDFFIEGSSIESISLFESFLFCEMKVVKLNKKNEEENLGDTDLVSYAPFIMNSIFKSISLKINDEEISTSVENYHAYEAYVNAMLHLTRNGQRSLLDGAGFFPSEPGTNDWSDPRKDLNTGAVLNGALNERYKLAQGKSTTGFATPIIWPLFLVPRVLPTKCELNISFKLNSSEFCLIAHKMLKKQSYDDAGNVVEEVVAPKPLPTYRIKIELAQLWLQKYRLSPQAQIRQEKMLSSGAVYPMMVNKTTSFMLEKGSTQGLRALTIASELPRMCYVFLVPRAHINNIQNSPFTFNHKYLSEIYMEADGSKYPSGISYTPDYDTGKIMKDWKLFQKELHYANPDLFFSSEDFSMSGFNVFPFNLVPDGSVDCSDYLSISENKSGNLNLFIKFGEELDEAVCVFVIMEYFRILSLDSQRKPSWISV